VAKIWLLHWDALFGFKILYSRNHSNQNPNEARH
jgi:hypothetical protein